MPEFELYECVLCNMILKGSLSAAPTNSHQPTKQLCHAGVPEPPLLEKPASSGGAVVSVTCWQGEYCTADSIRFDSIQTGLGG